MQMWPQLICGDIGEVGMWLKESKWYFYKIEIFSYGEINERNYSNPHPRKLRMMYFHKTIFGRIRLNIDRQSFA